LCNREIKFGRCLNYVRRLGATQFATGHYAIIEQRGNGPALFKARDSNKDQSYFLHAVPRLHLQDVLFPLGELTKAAVRDRARQAGLPVFDKPDSTGICFIGERPFADFLARYIPDSPGTIETAAGEVLGAHRGLPFYTLGQRGGLDIGGTRQHANEPWYVSRKDVARNALIVSQRHDVQALASKVVRTGPVNWLCEPSTMPRTMAAKVRYRQADQSVVVSEAASGAVELRFSEPQRAVTVGQYAVLYDGERCLGGGVIAETL
jgi:tRNA-specific 2-thiouridylase